jgi:hypothetical protein
MKCASWHRASIITADNWSRGNQGRPRIIIHVSFRKLLYKVGDIRRHLNRPKKDRKRWREDQGVTSAPRSNSNIEIFLA